ncbi:MAG: 2-amino-4-hydroxy-6-hydroxymethyldihydropteridine diphosphokinase [Deltaproteobacteria bacterium]|jgi:2-amino-4-hydroxy-6-hydroxymethyldihydropteridine diphosphokinase|nr:2-amino-4-hydroxy-6-hydroxymethyldihydropteridine diphosphokinase [Deltaproteobacteria bacterium]
MQPRDPANPTPPPTAREAAIGLGANLGDPPKAIQEALERLKALKSWRFLAQSSVYLTEPVGGPPGQPWYHNAVALFATDLNPSSVVSLLLEIERRMGRQRLERWGPRVIDLDLLYLGDVKSDLQEALTPHPRMHTREFVLRPLHELRPQWIHPLLRRSAQELLNSLPASRPQVRKLAPRAASKKAPPLKARKGRPPRTEP